MAETLTELVARISTDATELKRGLSEGEKATEASSKRMGESLKKVGMAMAASGAAITAALGLMGKAAIDEEINIKRLATTMENAGTSYDSVKDSLEAVIAATQRKTGIADDEQRDILGRLILITQDYEKALNLLPTVLDLAAVGQMDATTAATYLAKAYLDLENGAEKVSVRFGQASLQFKNMEDIQNRVAGAAENLANPLSILKASIGDVAEAIGSNLIPLIKDATNKIVDIAIKVQEWTKEHPELAKTLTLVTLGVGAVLTAVGGLILILPGLISGVTAFGVVFHAALGPIGLISIAIAGLIAGGIALWKNWDKVSKFFVDAWSNMRLATLYAVDAILGYLQHLLTFIPFFQININQARDNIRQMIDAEKVSRDTKRVAQSLGELNGAVQTLDKSVRIVAWDMDSILIRDMRNASKSANELAFDLGDLMVEQCEKGGEAIKDYSYILQNLKSEAEEALNAMTELARAQEMFWSYEYQPERYAAVMQERAARGELSPEAVERLHAEGVPGFQHGGIVENTGLAYLHEGERVISAGRTTGGVIVNFTQPVFFDREDTMNKFVDMIRKGIQRQDRLHFGGAYAGG